MLKNPVFQRLVLFALLSSLLALLFDLNFITYTTLFFGFPALYLVSKQKKQRLKTILFSLLFAPPLTLMIDYLISKDLGWQVISSLFTTRLLGHIVLEQFAWSFFFVLYLVNFYEYFLDKKTIKKTKIITPIMKIFASLVWLVMLIFVYLASNYAHLLSLPYAYLAIGSVIGLLPAVIFLHYYPHLQKRFFKTISFFFFLTFVNELTSLKLGHWIFPGTNFVGTLSLLGHKVPIEEIFFYFFVSSPMIFTYYEFLDDDRR